HERFRELRDRVDIHVVDRFLRHAIPRAPDTDAVEGPRRQSRLQPLLEDFDSAGVGFSRLFRTCSPTIHGRANVADQTEPLPSSDGLRFEPLDRRLRVAIPPYRSGQFRQDDGADAYAIVRLPRSQSLRTDQVSSDGASGHQVPFCRLTSQSLRTDQVSSDLDGRPSLRPRPASRNPSVQIRSVPTGTPGRDLQVPARSRNPSVQIRSVPTAMRCRSLAQTIRSQSLRTDQVSSDHEVERVPNPFGHPVAIPPYRLGQFRRVRCGVRRLWNPRPLRRNPSVQIRSVPTWSSTSTSAASKRSRSRNPSVQIRSVPTITRLLYHGLWFEVSQSLRTDQVSSDTSGCRPRGSWPQRRNPSVQIR